MKHSARSAVAVLAASSFSSVFAQTWCGKNYMANQTVVPPGGQFKLPAASKEPLVAFRCSPAYRPYLAEDGPHVSFIVDAPLVYQYIQGATPITISTPPMNESDSGSDDLGSLDVTINVGNKVFAQQGVPLDATGFEISLNITSLPTQKTQYNVTCSATYQPSPSIPVQKFLANTTLLYLPTRNSSVVKTDLRTGVLWAQPASGKNGPFQPFVPQGFYVGFSNLASNLSLINQLQADGFNTIHPIPPYDNATAFEQILNRTQELGLYVVYDMRSVYQNLTTVAQLVNTYSSLPNLLLWETAHEPDGNSDPHDAAGEAYNLIYELDGYHPVSIVLNCQDYNFSPYVKGADIVLEDAYPVGINATFSPVWHTPCTPDFGHCGCDNCQGSIYDIKARVQTYKNRLNVLGYDRSKTVWAVPQAFGSGAYWNTTPTGEEWASMGLTSLSHGATGSISYDYPTTSGNVATIEGTATQLTRVLIENVQPYIVNPGATYQTYNVQGVDASLWANGSDYVLLVTNLNQSLVYVPYKSIGLGQVTALTNSSVHRIFTVGQNTSTNETGLSLNPGAVGIYTVTPAPPTP